MIRLSIKRVRAGDLAAVSLPNPQEPMKLLMPKGYQVKDRVVTLLGRVGFRSLWLDVPGTHSLDPSLPETLLSSFRKAVAQAKTCHAKAGDGKLAKQDIVDARGAVRDLCNAIRAGQRQYIIIDDLDCAGDELGWFAAQVCYLALLLAIEGEKGSSCEPGAESTEAMIDLGTGALLHEIGKALMAPELLQKDEWDLTQAEAAQVRSYPAKGYRLLAGKGAETPSNVALCHPFSSEAIDVGDALEDTGMVLPSGIRPDRASRIVGIAHEFCQLVYRRRYVTIEALEEILCARKHQFDAALLPLLARVVPTFDLGARVILSSGHGGVVMRSIPDFPFRPHVLLLWDKDGTPLPESQQVELSLPDYPKAAVTGAGERRIDHLLPAEPDARWEGLA